VLEGALELGAWRIGTWSDTSESVPLIPTFLAEDGAERPEQALWIDARVGTECRGARGGWSSVEALWLRPTAAAGRERDAAAIAVRLDATAEEKRLAIARLLLELVARRDAARQAAAAEAERAAQEQRRRAEREAQEAAWRAEREAGSTAAQARLEAGLALAEAWLEARVAEILARTAWPAGAVLALWHLELPWGSEGEGRAVWSLDAPRGVVGTYRVLRFRDLEETAIVVGGGASLVGTCHTVGSLAELPRELRTSVQLSAGVWAAAPDWPRQQTLQREVEVPTPAVLRLLGLAETETRHCETRGWHYDADGTLTVDGAAPIDGDLPF